jgi:hypothetical protein
MSLHPGHPQPQLPLHLAPLLEDPKATAVDLHHPSPPIFIVSLISATPHFTNTAISLAMLSSPS